MKIRMLTSMAGAYESYAPGDEFDVRDEVAQAWQEAGIAEIIKTKNRGDDSGSKASNTTNNGTDNT